MKKIMSILLAVIMLMNVMVIGCVSAGATNLTYEDFTYTLNQNGEAIITGYTGTDSVITIPTIVDGHTVITIGQKAFEYNSNLSGVDLSKTSITTIENKAFKDCTSLISVGLPECLVTIGDSAFNYCKSLEYTEIRGNSFTIPDMVTTIGSSAFADCTSLKAIEIPAGVTQINNSAFNSCQKLESVVFNGKITRVGNSAFSGCTALNNITLPDTVNEIGSSAFSSCDALEYIKIPENVITISNYAFQDCGKLAEVKFNRKLNTIGELAFNGCISLKNLVLPENVTSIGLGAFGDGFTYSMKLETITILNPNCSLYQNESTIDDEATIICYENSLAHLYAIKYNRKFELLGSTPETNLGDVDGDGQVSVMDATAIQQHIAGIKLLSQEAQKFADTDKDGAVSIMDATQIQRFVAQLITEL